AYSTEAMVNLPLPSPWVSQDVGAVGLAGSAGYGNGVFTVTGSGADIWGSADAFRFVYVPVTGNCTLIARVASLQDVDAWSKAGLMIRASTNANAANAFIAVTPGNGVTWQSRSSTGGGTGNAAASGLTAPYWVKLERIGNTYTGYHSPDGVTWTQQGTATFTLPTTAYVGLALTSHNNSRLCTATFDNVTAPGWTPPLPPQAPDGLVAAAVSVSQINLTWNRLTNAANYIIKRSATDGGPYAVIASGLTMPSYTDSGLAENSTYYYVVSAVSIGGEGADSAQASASTTAPTGLTASALAANQISLTWNSVAGATSYSVQRSTVSGGPYSTIATDIVPTSHIDTVVIGMKYYYVVRAVIAGQETPSSAEATVTLPYPWQSQDVGAVGLAGNATYRDGVFTVAGSGSDVWDTTDAFRFVYVPVTGNCTLIARVASVQNINSWSKAGIMIRASTNADAANAFIAVTPGNGVTFQYRSTAGGLNNFASTPGLTAPYWIKLVRSGNTFTGYRSENGVTWTQQGTATFTMTATAYVGLGLTSHNNSSLCTATFDNVMIPGWPLLPGAPGSLTATAGSGQVTLSWPTVGGATSYNVKRSTTDGGPYAIVANVAAPDYTDLGLANGTSYHYVVSTLNPAGESANSAQATAMLQEQSPVLGISTAGTNLVLSWLAESTGFTLQSRTNLIQGDWLNVTSPAAELLGNQWQVTLPPTNTSMFYRLTK
ncbi:MAG TPA: hypothetical protein VK327_02960, partial [Candidatus Paceibacterota bacterium]|nr:hypothetical protein [Candidatus Paceibacterota bacterium]